MGLYFIPWVRFGLNALDATYRAKVYDPDGNVTEIETARRNVGIDTEIHDGVGALISRADNTFTLMGPGEVVGFTADAVALTEPVDGEKDLPVNCMPYVEFVDADFPWRYSIDEPDGERLKPWLALIALNRDEYADAPPSSFSRIISVNTKSLPDLEQSWAWAHIQVTVEDDDTTDDVARHIRDNPGCASSRILCARKLEPERHYTAFIVPVYEMGAMAARGEEFEESSRLSWRHGESKDMLLPYYYRFEFATAAMGDFAELVKLIRVTQDSVQGVRAVYDASGRPMGFQGIVKPADSADPDRKHNIAYAAGKMSEFESVCAGISDGDENVEPELALPLYGYNYCDNKTLWLPDGANGGWDHLRTRGEIWFSEMNFDRGFRYAASLGAATVRANQDEFVSRCFEIGGDVATANEYVNRYKVLKKLRRSVIKRHIIGRSDAKFLLTTKHLQKFYEGYKGKPDPKYPPGHDARQLEIEIRTPAEVSKSLGAYWDKLDRLAIIKIIDKYRMNMTAHDQAVVSEMIQADEGSSDYNTALEIIKDVISISVGSKPAGVLPKSKETDEIAVRQRIAERINIRLADRLANKAYLTDSADGPARGDGETADDAANRGTSVSRLADDVKKRTESAISVGRDLTKSGQGDANGSTVDSAQAALLLQRDSLNLSTLGLMHTAQWAGATIAGAKRINQAVGGQPGKTTASNLLEYINQVDVSQSEAAAQLLHDTADWYRRALLDTDVMRAGLREIIVKGADGETIGDSLSYLSPKLDEGLFDFLPQEHLEKLFPGLSDLPDNSSVMLEVNPKFLEAFLLGANVEMIQELIWREFPVNRQATIFNNFWEAYEDSVGDIKDVKLWGALGANSPGSQADNIIIAIRCDLFRRYPYVIPFAVEHRNDIDINDVVSAVFGGEDLSGVKVYPPLFSADLYNDLSLHYYGLTAGYMRAARSGADPKAFSFVMIENITSPKFGLGETKGGGQNDPIWGEFGVDAQSGYLNFSVQSVEDSAALADILLKNPCAAILDFERVSAI